MSASALVFLWTGVLLVGTLTMLLVLVRRAVAGRGPQAGGTEDDYERRDERGAPNGRQDGRQHARQGDDEGADGDARGEQAERLRNLLLSRMSHDLRSPLNSVVTLSQLLCEGNAGPLSLEQRRYVEVIRHSGQTLLALVNDILDLAAVESGRVEIEVGPVDLTALVEAVAEAAAPTATGKGVPVHVNAPEQRLLAEADEEHLRQVLQRLLEHAISETRNGYVEIAAERSLDRRHARLRVHETAAALADDARRALSEDAGDFDDYVGGEGDFAARGSAALPLVVAARLARLMGVHIAVEATGADGVNFDIDLPLSADEARPLASAASRAATDAAAAAALGPASGQILLIEDDLLERQRVRALLESSGFEVTQAGSGDEGLGLLRAGHFDAVILDLVMPGMSGLDVLRAARADERLSTTPFVVRSALYMTKGEQAVLGPGVTSVVRKGDPTADELVLSLRRALRAQPRETRPLPGGHGGPHA